MKKKDFRVSVDVSMFILICVVFATGLLMHYRLVPGYQGGRGLKFLELNRHEWGGINLWAAYGLVALVCLHLGLNAAFLKNVIARRKVWPLLLLASAAIGILYFFLAIPISH
mgnify:CR=1 FL=1